MVSDVHYFLSQSITIIDELYIFLSQSITIILMNYISFYLNQ